MEARDLTLDEEDGEDEVEDLGQGLTLVHVRA